MITYNEYGEKIEVKKEMDKIFVYHSDCGEPAPKTVLLDIPNYPFLLDINTQKLYNISLGELSLIDKATKDEGGSAIQFHVNNKESYFTEGLCILCLCFKKEFESHHVVWRSEKGRDSKYNLLRICKSCHARLTSGDEVDRLINVMCCHFMFWVHGIRFGIEYAQTDRNLLPRIRERFAGLERKQIDAQLRAVGRRRFILLSRMVTGRKTDLIERVLKYMEQEMDWESLSVEIWDAT